MPSTKANSPLINKTVLMSGAEYFSVKALNPYSDESNQPDVPVAVKEHASIKAALQSAGVTVISVDAPKDCQDGVYTANWGLCRGDTVIASSLPGPRQLEEPYARDQFQKLGKKIITPPYRFSGQGDSLPIGNYLLAGSGYRTDIRMHQFIADKLGFDVISLETIPLLDASGTPVMNRLTGWPDSLFYDIDLAICILAPDLIGWCPDAFTEESQAKIRALTDLKKIEISLDEAVKGFACNLVSTGRTVVMSGRAPRLKAAIQAHGLTTITPDIVELLKGGGYIRCTTLTLDNG